MTPLSQKLPSIVRDTTILLVASAFLAFAYNALSSKRLPWVRVASDRIMASDSLINTLSTASAQATTNSQQTASQNSGQEQTATPSHSGQTMPALAAQKDSLKTVQNLASKRDSLKSAQNLASKKETPKSVTTIDGKQTPQTNEKAASASMASAPASNNSTASATTKPLEIRIDQVEKLLANPDVLFIDARKANEFEKGRIGNAINIFTPEFEQNIPRIIGLPREKPIVVYCGGGACELSHELAGHLVGLGFTRVFVYTGGWNEWQLKKG